MAEGNQPKILIIDLGSQYTLVIARTLREMGYRSAVLSPDRAEEWLGMHAPTAVVLSGGDSSVTDADAPQVPKVVWSLDVPVLGICYGMQYMVHHSGGEVRHVQGHAEYGPARVTIDTDSVLFNGLEAAQDVWASHGDTCEVLPEGYTAIGSTEAYPYCAITHESGLRFGVQFHPEVQHTPNGAVMLQNFMDVAGCERDWEPRDMVAGVREEVTQEVGGKGKVVIGFSGGVDSTTLAAVLVPALGERLVPITVDVGQFREGELSEIRETAESIGVQLRVVDKTDEMLAALKGVTDAEEKRATFRAMYKKIFDEAIVETGAGYIAQGSLATDFIESGATGGAMIKTHHNIGLDFNVMELHPLRDLFKYEVRALADELGIGARVAQRKPFPGPGLFLRVVGGEVTRERLELVRWADARVTEILEKHGLHEGISQLIVALICVDTVGVKGDARAYGPAIVVRAVETVDFMTAHGVQFPPEVRREISTELGKHKGIVRVWYDEMSKPPATTEFE